MNSSTVGVIAVDDAMQTHSRSTSGFERSPTVTPICDLTPYSIKWLICAKVTDLDMRPYLTGNGYVMDITLQDSSEPVSREAAVSRLAMGCSR